MLYHEANKDAFIEINTKQLYKALLKQKIPFHYWYKWAEKMISEIGDH